jgi:polyisoprenyl-phosphate glycosyltransferase
MDSKRSLDIVIPVYNEASVLPQVFERLRQAFAPERLAACGVSTMRAIFVDDGSTDPTATLIVDKIKDGFPAALLSLSRNFGHQAALAAGLDYASADLVAIMDADLQDPPEFIPAMVTCLDEGFDIVIGQRRNRQERFFKRFCYWAFYRICSFLSEVPMPLDAGDFCVLTSEVVQALRRLPEKLRFQRGLRGWIGFRQTTLAYDRPGRELGATKYTWRKLYALATDGIASISIRPLRITQVLLFFSAIVTIGYLAIMTMAYLRSDRSDPHILWFLATQGLIALTSALQLFCFYILGAYVGRMYLEVKARPSYIIMRTVPQTPEKSV